MNRSAIGRPQVVSMGNTERSFIIITSLLADLSWILACYATNSFHKLYIDKFKQTCENHHRHQLVYQGDSSGCSSPPDFHC